jgi:integration host factor subunit alpha
MKTMTKHDLVQGIHDRLGLSKQDSARVVGDVFEIMKETLSRGDSVKITGFGSFMVRDKEAWRGRNPKTGETIEVSARKALTFRPSQLLKRELNNR